jgi:type IV pilus assembly protein PilN
MIRINLLGVERKARKTSAFDVGRQVTVACGLILVGTVLGLGWWYWTLTQEKTRVDADIAAARSEQARLRSLLTEVQEFEARRAQLQQRVQLIEQLRAGQSIPVQLLDHVSRSLPDMLWLTDMEQTADTLTIQGRAMTLLAVSDFVRDLGATDLLLKPIDIPNTQVEPLSGGTGQPTVDVIRFTVRAAIKPRVAPTPAAATKKPAAAVKKAG